MIRTRLTALVMALGLATAGLSSAAAAPGQRPADRLDPQRAVHAAVTGLLSAPDQERLADLRLALTQEPATEAAVATAAGPREWAAVSAAGDVDGDRRADVIVERTGGTAVRSGRDGRLLLKRADGFLLPVPAAGAVRLLSVQHSVTETARAFRLDVRLEGLDRTGRAVWTHTYGGTVEVLGVGPAFVARLDGVPAMLYDGLLDPDGRSALLIGALSATQTSAGTTSAVEPTLLDLADGSTSPLPTVRAVGRGVAWAFPVHAQDQGRSCYATSAPVGPVTRLSLVCDGTASWSSTVRLRDPFVDDGGDFDGDGLSDLVAGTYGYQQPRPREVFRGTQVLSFADGSALGRSAIDALQPLRVDIDGDARPDFLELSFEPELAVRALGLTGEQIWRRVVAVKGEVHDFGLLLGLDITGDGVGDGLVVAGAEKAPSTSVVVDGRNGRTFAVQGVTGLLLPGLRAGGADLAVLEQQAGRARATVLSGDRGRRLLTVTVPGPTGTVSAGGAGAVDVDRDGRRDLVVASRTDDHQVTTAFSAGGQVLWQSREKAPRVTVELHMAEATTCC